MPQIHRRTLARGLATASTLAVIGIQQSRAHPTPGASPVVSGDTREIVHPGSAAMVPVHPQRVPLETCREIFG